MLLQGFKVTLSTLFYPPIVEWMENVEKIEYNKICYCNRFHGCEQNFAGIFFSNWTLEKVKNLDYNFFTLNNTHYNKKIDIRINKNWLKS